jgi:hypothetical protein
MALAIPFLLLATSLTVVSAQTSASYEQSEQVLNAGGASGGNSPSSASFRLSLVAIGEIAAAPRDPPAPPTR